MFEAGRTFRLSAGEWLLLRPGLRHGGLAALRGRSSCFTGGTSSRAARKGARGLRRCRRAGVPAAPGGSGSTTGSCFRSSAKAVPAPGADLLAELLLLEAGRRSEGKAEKAASGLAERARTHIRLHFDESLSTGASGGGAAVQCRLPGTGLCRRSWGCTVTEEINRVRLAHACRLLLAGKLNVKEVAYESGFNDLAYFRRRFRALYGQTPAEYRKAPLAGARQYGVSRRTAAVPLSSFRAG